MTAAPPADPRRWRPFRRAAAWLVLLGPLFYLSYGLANGWAAGRAHVPSVVFAWEHGIPFWPWTIFPYWSINAFYALSLFLGRSRHGVDRHAARLLTVQLLAVTCFLLWPLHFSFGQPAASGAPAFLFNALRGFDQPFNQAPSLHIALAVILWDWYRQFLHSSWARLLLHAWTLLICASVLTTWQHHFIDIPTGAALGVLCVWLWPLERVAALPRAWRLAREPRRRVLAGLYGLGATACLGLALVLAGSGYALWLGWPALSLALVALNYAGLGARGFRMDRRGRMHWSARWLLAPYRLAAALNAWLWTRRLPASVLVAPGLRLGRIPTLQEWTDAGRPRLLGLCAELQLPDVPGARCVPLLDLVPAPPRRLQRAVVLLDGQAAAAAEAGVWVCCALGFSRSAATAVAWLCHVHPADGMAGALATVRRARPQMVLGTAWTGTLAYWAARQPARPTHKETP